MRLSLSEEAVRGGCQGNFQRRLRERTFGGGFQRKLSEEVV